MRKRSALVLVALITLATASCATTAPDGSKQPVQLLTPIPGVSTTERLLAAADCVRGLGDAGLNVSAITKATDEENKAKKAKEVLEQAKAQNVGRDTLKACRAMIDNAARAAAIRAEQKAAAPPAAVPAPAK